MATVTKPSLNVSAAVSAQAFTSTVSSTTIYTVPANSYAILNATLQIEDNWVATDVYQAEIRVDDGPAITMTSDGVNCASSVYGNSTNAAAPLGTLAPATLGMAASAQIVAGPGQTIKVVTTANGSSRLFYGYIRGVVLTNT